MQYDNYLVLNGFYCEIGLHCSLYCAPPKGQVGGSNPLRDAMINKGSLKLILREIPDFFFWV